MWDQNPGNYVYIDSINTYNISGGYNSDCPYDYTHQTNSVTGCGATAMAQVMKYWNYPNNGTGTHSYYSNNYGTQYVDFGNTTYQWALMPDYLTNNSTTTQLDAIANLMYHCGVSIDMDYSYNESSLYLFGNSNGSEVGWESLKLGDIGKVYGRIKGREIYVEAIVITSHVDIPENFEIKCIKEARQQLNK